MATERKMNHPSNVINGTTDLERSRSPDTRNKRPNKYPTVLAGLQVYFDINRHRLGPFEVRVGTIGVLVVLQMSP